MGITVREALQIGGLKNAKVIAGEKGLDRIINFVLVMDVPDASKWIRGNELLLTSGYVFKNNPDIFENIILELDEKNCAALAIKIGRFIDTLPDSIIEKANKKNFPIIELPIYISWHDVINPLLLEILNKEVLTIKRSQEIHSEFMKIALNGEGLDEIAKALSYLIKCIVFIEDENFNILAYYYNIPVEDWFKEIIKAGKLSNEVIEEMEKKGIINQVKTYKKPVLLNVNKEMKGYTRILAPIFVKNEICGYIDVFKNCIDFDKLDLIAIEQATTVATIEIMKKQEIMQAEGKAKKEFFENLLLGNIIDSTEIKKMLRNYNINLRGDIAIIVINMSYENAIKIEKEDFRSITNVLMSYFQQNNFVILRRSEDVILIVGLEEKNDKKDDKVYSLCKILLKNLGNMNDITFGISDYHANITEISEGYKEAKRTLELMKVLKNKKEKIVFYKEIWIYDFLLNIDKEKLKKYCDKKLLRVLEYDATNKGEDLFHTLEVFLDCMGRHNLAAEKLFIHRNTLNYRLNKIREILDCDLNDPFIRMKIEIGLKIINLLYKC